MMSELGAIVSVKAQNRMVCPRLRLQSRGWSWSFVYSWMGRHRCMFRLVTLSWNDDAGREDSIQSSWASQVVLKSSLPHGNNSWRFFFLPGASLNAGAGHLWRCPWKKCCFFFQKNRWPKLSKVTDTTTSMGTQAWIHVSDVSRVLEAEQAKCIVSKE